MGILGFIALIGMAMLAASSFSASSSYLGGLSNHDKKRMDSNNHIKNHHAENYKTQINPSKFYIPLRVWPISIRELELL